MVEIAVRQEALWGQQSHAQRRYHQKRAHMATRHPPGNEVRKYLRATRSIAPENRYWLAGQRPRSSL